MQRRRFMELTAATGAGLAAGGLLPPGLAGAQDTRGPEEPAMDVRTYLCREARRITDGTLADFVDAATHARLLPAKRQQYREMMGLDHLWPGGERPPVPVHVTGTVQRNGYRIEKLHYESLPRLHVTANLYVPEPLAGPAPGVIYVCGHSEQQKVHYQAHPRRFAQLGFVCLIVETVQLGEVTGYHHGCYREGWWHWYSRGYTPAGVELLNAIRGLDLLQARPDVDGEHLGVTGISGGGATSWWLAAGDERIKVAAPVCGTAALASHINDRTIDGHCDCMWWTNTYLWDLPDVGALIAPRPLMIASADHDGIFTIESIREVHERLAKLYATLGVPENLVLVETPGEHSYHERSRTAIFSWFLKHLQGRDVPPAEVGDIDDSPAAQEPFETLQVYVSGPPADNITATIQDELIPLAGAPEVADADELLRVRHGLVDTLREHTFRAFPVTPCDKEVRTEFEFSDGASRGCRFSFAPEEGWRLTGRLVVHQDAVTPAPTAVILRSPGEERSASEALSWQLGAWSLKSLIETRGTGETGYDEALQWHLRRAAAWCGRTLAGMRVYDVLRALQVLRGMPEVANDAIALVARGEMAAVALYAALLDGGVAGLVLQDPPATQNAASQPDGRGPAIEMLNCLRHTDLPYVAGLLWPTAISIVGDCPATYDWARELYGRLGAPGRFEVLAALSDASP